MSTEVEDKAFLSMSRIDCGTVWFEFVSVTMHRKLCKWIISTSI